MDPRLDPACEEARALEARHRQQESLLIVDRDSQLANVVLRTHANQLEQHRRSCARCVDHARPRGCPACGFDTKRARHGWMCPEQGSRWPDVLPWNWRPRHAPAARAQAASPSAPAGTGPSRRVDVREVPHARAAPAAAHAPPAGPASAPGRAGASAAAPTPSPAAGGGSVATRPASSAPKPRPKPAAPKPNALELAYQTLGVSPSASDEDVRAAYRAKAQQYHPDKVATMAPEFREVAEKKMKEINHAYERVKRAR